MSPPRGQNYHADVLAAIAAVAAASNAATTAVAAAREAKAEVIDAAIDC